MVELVSEKTGVRISRMLRAELGLAPGPMDSDRVNTITRTVREMISQNKIATKHAVFSVPGQSVFIRRIKFPRTSEDRLHRIVAYEARQQIPFALDNSLMEYQVFDYGDSGEVEVLLVAIKKDIVLEFMKVVNKAGLKPVMISVSSLALFNFHVFDSTPFQELLESLEASRTGEMPAEQTKPSPGTPAKKKGFAFPKFSFGTKKKLDIADVAEAEPVEGIEPLSMDFNTDLPEDIYEEVKAYINIGAQTFDLAIARHGRHKMLGFTRSVPWAGNELTRMLTDKLRLGSSQEAEQIKRERAIAVIPGREDEAEAAGIDPHASEFVAQWADRMILEVRKSFDFYIAQPDGMAVDNIVITGGQAQQRNLSAYIEEKLGIPVDVRVAPENGAFSFSDGATPDETVSFVVATGLALSGLGLGQVTVDFLPTELKTIREFKKKNIEIFALLGLLLLIIAVSYMAGSKEIEDMNRWLAENQGKIETVNRTKAQLDKARNDRKAIDDKVKALGEAMGDRTYWLEFLGMLEGVKPTTILLTSINMNPNGTVDLVGETAENVGAIATFSRDLGEQKDWVKRCDISLPPQERFSRMINRPVTQFGLHIETNWKQTRLAPARVTLAPGQYTPSATPIGTIAPAIGDLGMEAAI